MLHMTEQTDPLEYVLSQPDPESAVSTLARHDVDAIAIQYVSSVASQRRRALVRRKEAAARAVALPDGSPVETLAARTRAAGADSARSTARAAYKAVMVSKFAPLLDERIDLGGGRSTTWGHATADEHQERIIMLSRQADGIADSISLHREAVAGMSELGIISLEWLAR